MPPEVPLADWVATLPGPQPFAYTFAEAEAAIDRNDSRIAWPEGLPLYIRTWTGTMEEAAAAYGVPLETLQALNPGAQREDLGMGDGTTAYCWLKLADDDYQLPREPVKLVTVETPWVEFAAERSDTYEVPAALSDQAAACLATAYDFYTEHWRMHIGIDPSEPLAENSLWQYSVDGALVTTYTDLVTLLQGVFTPAAYEPFLGGPLTQEILQGNRGPLRYYQGEDDRLCFITGDSGSFIGDCGSLYTEPQLQPDGSLLFWRIDLSIESEDFAGWEEEKTYTPDTACAVPVRLQPTASGWRVSDF